MRQKSTFLFFAAHLGWTAAGLAQEPLPSRPPVAIILEAPLSSIRLGARIPLIATMTNISGGEISFSGRGVYGYPEERTRSMLIRVYDSDGGQVALNVYGEAIYGQVGGGGPPFCCDQWQPGESFIEVADVNKEFRIGKPGRYTAQALYGAPDTAPPYRVVIASNTVSFTLVPDGREAQVPNPSFTIRIAASAASIPAGSPLSIIGTITNVSSHSVPVRREYNFRRGREVPHRLIARVVDSRGEPVPETEFGMTVHTEVLTHLHGFLAAVLKPGESFREEADLSKEFVLTKPGAYTVELIKRDPDTGEMVRSNAITVTVTQ
jgi:hypothetical protein